MQFHTGCATYTVRRKYNLCIDGDRVQGYIDHESQEIYVDGEIEGRDDVQKILRHEQVHAWEWHAGACRMDGEDRAQFVSMCGETFSRDWHASGAIKAFRLIPIEGDKPPTKQTTARPYPPSLSDAQRCCGACGQAVAPGSIGSLPAVPLGGGRFATDRFLVCPVCGVLTRWQEGCDEAGRANGAVVNAVLLRGEQASEWLKVHPAPPCEWNVA